MKNYSAVKFLCAVLALAALAGCRRAPSTGLWQGYFEGEFVHVAAPLAGRLEHLAVTRGTRIETGTPLFRLEQAAEQATHREAVERLRQAEAKVADLSKGQRPTELAALEARVAQAAAAADLSAREFARLARLHDAKVVSDDDLDRARLTHEANLKQVAGAEAQLATAQLGARADVITAAEADAAAARAAVDRAAWSLAQKSPVATASALIYDTLYREGEFVPAGAPVVSLLPPENLKVRFFVPEAEFANLKAGDTVQVHVSGRANAIAARISYLSPQPEYTPPILYNRENRAKLVFMIEAQPIDAAAARDFHPGQPVDVRR
ncbi:MAG: secretion protein HlyD [Opitutus sp.]|nr:secretion protein HlyD [Opitutus sp.]